MTSVDPKQLKSNALRRLVERGFCEQATDLQALDQALSHEKLTFYIGFDATASSLHAGSLVQLMTMRILQQDGHRPICLIGGGTTRVGDPSGKNETRKLLSPEQIENNAQALKAQFSRFIHFDKGEWCDAVLLNNADWLLDLKYIDFLRDFGRHFTVNRMIATKTYRDRLEAELPLSFLEFNYQLLQAYDFCHLHDAYNCRLEVGGSDQWGNIVAGIELIRRIQAEKNAGEVESNDEKSHDKQSGKKGSVFAFTTPLLTTADGKKMGKTESGAVWLDPKRFSPFDYYQYWYNTGDADVEKMLRVFTEIPMEEILKTSSISGSAINELKHRLAFEATKLLHGEEQAQNAQTASKQAFGVGDDWSALPCIELKEPEIKLVDLLVHEKVAAFRSRREAKPRIESGAVKINGEACSEPNTILKKPDYPDGLRLQATKKKRFRVSFA